MCIRDSPTAQPASAANLIVSSLTGQTYIILAGGQAAASYVVRVKNVGGQNAGAFNVTLTYPNGQVFDYTIASLNAGQEANIPDITAQFTTPGTYRLSIFVDSSGNITESNKGDNLAFLDIVVVQPTPTPEGAGQ
jgi:subtilase family serine protease